MMQLREKALHVGDDGVALFTTKRKSMGERFELVKASGDRITMERVSQDLVAERYRGVEDSEAKVVVFLT